MPAEPHSHSDPHRAEPRDASHPDAIQRLRTALWSDAEPGAARHVRECEPCTAELEELRRIRDVMRAARDAAPSEDAVRAVLAAVGECARQADEDAELDFSWLQAMPIGTAAGVRGMACEGLLRCVDDDLQLDLLLGSGLSGQVLAGGDEPCAGLEVTLFLDRRPAGAVRTDRFGEFSLDVRRGSGTRSVGVRVSGRGRPRHVEIWRAGEAS